MNKEELKEIMKEVLFDSHSATDTGTASEDGSCRYHRTWRYNDNQLIV